MLQRRALMLHPNSHTISVRCRCHRHPSNGRPPAPYLLPWRRRGNANQSLFRLGGVNCSTGGSKTQPSIADLDPPTPPPSRLRHFGTHHELVHLEEWNLGYLKAGTVPPKPYIGKIQESQNMNIEVSNCFETIAKGKLIENRLNCTLIKT